MIHSEWCDRMNGGPECNCEASEPPKPVIQTKTASFNRGDYVLATKYDDGDPADQWCVGFYMGPTPHNRHYVGDANGGPGPHGFRFSGFRRVAFIDKDLGEWLVRNAVELEKAPAGSINLQVLCAARNKYLADMAALTE